MKMMMEFENLGLSAELARTEMYAMADYAAIKNSLGCLDSGFVDGGRYALPHSRVLVALNCHSGILCGSLEMMKYEFPSMQHEPALSRIREQLLMFKSLAIDAMEALGITDIGRHLRRYSCKFRELFTPGWLESRGYTDYQRERVLNVAIRCARAFLQFLESLLVRLETLHIVDDMRPIAIGAYASQFVLMCNRCEGVVVMRCGDGLHRMFEISPNAKQAWRVIRALVSSREADGKVKLPQRAMSNFHNTDANNNQKTSGLSEFASYIHATGETGTYTLKPYRKRNYEH